jgi:hypothetical protein
MTLSASQDEATSRRGRLMARFARFDDGIILKFAFYAMLIGTASVLVIDYLDLTDSPPLPETGHTGNPVLPAVDRPEVDPDNPAFRPTERIDTPPEVLSAPLDIALISGGIMKLTGTISVGSAARFTEEVRLRGEYIETIALDSPGGSVEDALAIARLIRERGFSTAVGDGALCASSCPLVLAAGSERLVSDTAAVGVHQIYAAASDAVELAPAQAMSDAQSTTARITRFLTEMDVDAALWLHALETPPNRLYYLTHDEMTRYRLASSAEQL